MEKWKNGWNGIGDADLRGLIMRSMIFLYDIL